MKNIADELSRVELLRMSDGLVGDFESGNWMVVNHPQGKLIVDSTFQLGAVLPRASIKTLGERAKRKVFEWTTEDGSLSVHGRDGHWDMVFRMKEPPYCMVTASLSGDETKMIKKQLFAKKEGVKRAA